jgi:excisionase family DNA binding protein
MRIFKHRDFDSPILTVKECCDFLKVCPSTIYRLLKRNGIPAFKIGSDWRFSKKQLTEWIESRPKGEVERSPRANGRHR